MSNISQYTIIQNNEKTLQNINKLKKLNNTHIPNLQIQQPPKTKYNRIDQDQRLKVIELHLNSKMSLKQISKQLGLKPSTCKAIVQIYEKEGRIEKKKHRQKKVKIINTIIISKMDMQQCEMKDDIQLIFSCFQHDISSVKLNEEGDIKIFDNQLDQDIKYQSNCNMTSYLQNSELLLIDKAEEMFLGPYEMTSRIEKLTDKIKQLEEYEIHLRDYQDKPQLTSNNGETVFDSDESKKIKEKLQDKMFDTIQTKLGNEIAKIKQAQMLLMNFYKKPNVDQNQLNFYS